MLRLALVALVAALLQGCAIQPWVKPYEREKLSDPIMQFSRAALADKHREHIHAVREGPRLPQDGSDLGEVLRFDCPDQ